MTRVNSVKGKRVAVVLGLSLIGLVAVGGFFLRDMILDGVWLFAVRCGNSRIAMYGAVTLIDRGCLTAIPTILSAFEKHMREADSDTREAWLHVVGHMASMGPQAVEILGKCVADRKWSLGTRHVLYSTVGTMAVTDDRALDILIDGVYDKDPRVKEFALMNLLPAGPRAAKSVPAVSRVLSDEPEPGLRAMAAYLLGFIGGGGATSALTRALRDTSEKVRTEAANAIKRIEGRSEASSK